MLTKVFNLNLIILQVILVGCNTFNDSQRKIPTSSYYEMPPLYQFDDYDKCVDSRTSFSYCVVYAEIEPNASSPLWNQIDMYSKDGRHHYRHDRLFFGVCVEDCKTLLKSLPDFQQQELYDKMVGSNEGCNNLQIKQLLTSFSIYRNYYRLLAPSSVEKNDLKFINGLRVFLLFCVVMAHSVVLDMLIQTQNPQYFEKFYYNPEIAIFTNGAVIIQIFFFFAGFFLKLKFDELQLVSPRTSLYRCIGVYFKVFLARYLRIVPSLMILILFNGFLLSHMGDGPFWRHITEAEHVFCREYWWQNLFMINNFLLKQSCCQHTWFLATDIQLTEFFLIVFILVAKTYRYVFFKDFDTMYQSYVPFYTNLSGYIFGFICAEIYENYVHLEPVGQIFLNFFISNLVAFIMTLTLEYPVARIIKYFINK
uniref:Acyltransferase 3 domain-containing protein n=1 Tax=Glossina austeni TaxID=7395 RepID=A0A1A9VM92_GLOAU